MNAQGTRRFKYFIYLFVVSALLTACGGNKVDSLPNATITVNDEGGKAAGLDLQALGELVKKSSNPKILEETLNQPGSINNLDLDNDGKVDFIKVAETSTGDNAKGLLFTDITSNGDSTPVANIQINKGTNNQASMDINGSPTVYNNNNSYHSDFPIGEVLLMAYLFSPHPMYYSPYYYGRYPGYYHPYGPVSPVVYNRTVTTYTSHPTGSLSKSTSSRSSLSSPSSSQKSFTTRSSSKPVGSGGFGNRSSNSSSSSHSYSSSSSSSRRSFGSSRRR